MSAKFITRIATTAAILCGSFFPANLSVNANSPFQEQAIEQSLVVAVARPYGEGKFDLLVLEQIPGKQPCWTESGSNPTLIDPLLLNFNFSGICRRATDSNGYSIRLDGQDLGLDYLLRVVPRNGELVLVGTARVGNYPEIMVGRTGGLAGGFMKLHLNPGWQFTKRTYNGKILGHFYVSGSRTALQGAGATSPSPETTTSPDTEEVVVTESTSVDFSDIDGNVYQPQIEVAVKEGFVAGFEDGTFRPEEQVTREQLISMGVDAIGSVYDVDLTAEPERDVIPFRDIEDTRWSAEKIKWAQWNFLTLGNPNNTLQPEEPITRAELVDTMRHIAIHLRKYYDLPGQLPQTQNPESFADIDDHWAGTVITQMSGYCGVATALNEEGTAFEPDAKVTRDYTAAALVRTVDCVKTEAKAASR